MPNTDRIEKEIVLRAPIAKVWRAVGDAREFGSWFGVALEGTFSPGATLRGAITAPGYEHVKMEILIEEVVPERRLSYRWHPYAIEPGVDYSSEATTLVVFDLESVPEGTKLSIVESGFDAIPAARRAEAFRMNDQGWSIQAQQIERHVSTTP